MGEEKEEEEKGVGEEEEEKGVGEEVEKSRERNVKKKKLKKTQAHLIVPGRVVVCVSDS